MQRFNQNIKPFLTFKLNLISETSQKNKHHYSKSAVEIMTMYVMYCYIPLPARMRVIGVSVRGRTVVANSCVGFELPRERTGNLGL